MFILVQENDYARYGMLLDRMHRLRKDVFFDRLGWNVTVNGDRERDRYDDIGPAYLLWCDVTRSTLYGSLRLLPTTGPTLLNDMLRQTFPAEMDFSHPLIWESTHICVDTDAIAAGLPGIDSGSAMIRMLVALAECALAKGITMLACGYEPEMKRVYRQAGVPLDEIGCADGFGAQPLCCGLFGVTGEVVDAMHRKTGLSGLYARKPRLRLVDTPSMFETEALQQKLHARSNA